MKQSFLNKIISLFSRYHIAYIILIFSLWGLFYLNLIKNLNYMLVDNDWFQHYYYAETFRKIILEYHQFPLRSPFMGGGYPIIGHPFDITLTPFAIFVLVFGAVKGTTIIALLLSLLGAFGMLYLTKIVLRYNWIGAFFSTSVFMLSKWGLNMIADGNYTKLYYWLLPWPVAFFIKSRHNKKFIIFSGITLYLILVQGGLILIPIILFLFLFSVLLSIEIKNTKWFKIDISYIIIFLVIVIFTLCLSALKVIPLQQLLEMKSRYIHLPYEDSYADVSVASKMLHKSLDWQMLRQCFLDRNFYDDPYALYFGYIPLILSVLACVIYFSQIWRFLLLLIIFIFVIMGSNAPIDIFKWIWHMHPVVHGIWKLDKYFIIFILFLISLISGKFFLVLEKKPGKEMIIKLASFLVVSLCIFDMFFANRIYYDINSEICFMKKPEFRRQDNFFQIKLKERCDEKGAYYPNDLRSVRAIFYLLQQNIGLVNFNWDGNIKINEAAVPKYIIDTVKTHEVGVEETNIPRYEIDAKLYRGISGNADNLIETEYINPQYKGEVSFLKHENKASLKYFSPNKILIDTAIKSPDILVINQNYHKGWRSDRGGIINYHGLLAVQFSDKGIVSLRLDYIPADFYIGLLISAVTFIFMVWFLSWKYITKRFH